MLTQTFPTWMPRLSFAPVNTAPRGDTLVVVFLRGAADVLNMVVPHGEDAYYQLRPSLGIARPDDSNTKKEDRAVDLDGFFGLHPTMQPLLEAWQSEHLAIIHACGAPDESRSHFKAMELMERGVDDERGPASGWIGRHLATLNTGNSSPLRAVGMGTRPQRSLSGSGPRFCLTFHCRLSSRRRSARPSTNACRIEYNLSRRCAWAGNFINHGHPAKTQPNQLPISNYLP